MLAEDKWQPASSYHVMRKFWITNNTLFLFKYWATAREALQRVVSDPESFTEFRGGVRESAYVDAVVSGHLEHHNYSGVLLAYATLDEFMARTVTDVGRARNVLIAPNELRDRGIKKYHKFVHKVCRVADDEVNVDWTFLEDFALVRNAIIHANGNKSLLGRPTELDRVVERYDPLLGLKHSGVKLFVSDEYVHKSIDVTANAALALNDLAFGMTAEGTPGQSQDDGEM